jgi:lactoylglutathione lyase/methylmalonyl-CoA/ethylmalonyl-CoA epimerase
MIKKIAHIGIAVQSMSEGLSFFHGVLGLKVSESITREDMGLNITLLRLGEVEIELLEATRPDTPVAKFVSKHGPGIHHVAVEVDDLRGTMADLEQRGFQLIDKTPRTGAHGRLIAFVHPCSAGGVLLELEESPPTE